ncbi:hypothetical protein SB766_07565 [Pseudomonas sp. SIMBA_077]
MLEYEFEVVSGQLILLPKTLPDQIKKDILHTQLYAQIYASADADRFSDAEAWDKRLTFARSELKWATRSTMARHSEPADEATINVTTLILNQLARARFANSSVMGEAIKCGLKALVSSSPAHKVFFDSILKVTHIGSSSSAEVLSEVSFQVSVVSPVAHMIDIQIGFSVRKLLDEHVFETMLTGKDVVGPMSLSVSEYELDTFDFSHVRDKVVDNLEGAEKTLIVSLALPPPVVITAP